MVFSIFMRHTLGVNGKFGSQDHLFDRGQKKWSTAVLQPFVNLKSNTMKNTLQI